MKDMPKGLQTSGMLMLTILAINPGCKRDTIAKRVLKTFEAPAWTGREGLMIVKTETPESDVLLMRLRPIEEGIGELFGTAQGHEEPQLDEVIYLYDPSRELNELEAFDLEMWNKATGPEWWDLQQERRVPKRLKINMLSGMLNYKRTEVPTIGDTISYVAKSMHPGSQLVLILSAKKRNLGFSPIMDENAPRLERFYHQAYDLKTMVIVGEPVPLPFESEQLIPRGVWAGTDKYAVYTDARHSPIHIVHMDWMPRP